MSPELFRNILFSLSGLSFGAAGYALWAYSALFRRAPDKLDSVGHIMVKISWLLTVGIVFLTIIIPITAIPPTLEGWVYVIGLVLGFVGFILVARAEHRHADEGLDMTRRHGDRREE